MARMLDPPPQEYSDSLSDSEEYDSDEPPSALGYSEMSTVNQDADWEQQVDIDSVSPLHIRKPKHPLISTSVPEYAPWLRGSLLVRRVSAGAQGPTGRLAGSLRWKLMSRRTTGA